MLQEPFLLSLKDKVDKYFSPKAYYLRDINGPIIPTQPINVS
jgi:hypothetical protein